jgi:ferric-dicitrate binding protein FerR (iron transport regulator)
LKKEEFLLLLDKYLEGRATEQETDLLMRYYNSFQQNPATQPEPEDMQQTEDRMLQHIHASIEEEKRGRILKLFKKQWPRVAVAASILLVAGSILFWPSTKEKQPLAKTETNTPKPASQAGKITLTLSDGKKIILDDLPNGTVAQRENFTITKQNGTLVVNYNSKKNPSSNSYNILSVANGKQYQVVLPDKSRVWLNTASTLKFPSAFAANERKVTLSGEAYFEIAKNRKKPFRVKVEPNENDSDGALVEVLGTHFNIAAYNDEETMKTTLLEGSVRITSLSKSRTKQQTKTLVPGQQALITNRRKASKKIDIRKANTKEVMAWKSGLFDFNNADIPTIMREIARWYHVEIAYEGSVPHKIFTGTINRSLELQTVLKILEQSNIHTQQRDNKIIVTY